MRLAWVCRGRMLKGDECAVYYAVQRARATAGRPPSASYILMLAKADEEAKW